MRGPILYCLEEVDNDFNVLSVALIPDPGIGHEYKDGLLGGVTILTGSINLQNMTDSYRIYLISEEP